MPVWHSVLNVKALISPFHQERALEGAFTIIVKTDAALIEMHKSAHSLTIPHPFTSQYQIIQIVHG